MKPKPEQTTVEFDCRDCGQHIIALGLTEVPADQRCGICQHLVEFVPDEFEREAIRRQLHGNAGQDAA